MLEKTSTETFRESGVEREVVVLMSDMVGYSNKSSDMRPEEIRDFIIDYHNNLNRIIGAKESQPVDIEPSAGDGALIVFEKKEGEGEEKEGICSRAVNAAARLARSIELGETPPTRMGLFLGSIIDAKLGKRVIKFSSCFSVANRLEELCGHFGTRFLMDREVARFQHGWNKYLVSIGKFTLTSAHHPMNAYAIYAPGMQNIPTDVDEAALGEFIAVKNNAMELFCGNQLIGIQPDFPKVRIQLLEAQKRFMALTGCEDLAIDRILEYIRETPYPDSQFNVLGMKMMEKKRDSLGERLFHLSKQLLKAMNPDFYHALVVDTEWEKYFKLEWKKKGSVIIKIGDAPDGIYYMDSGSAVTYNEQGVQLSSIESGTIFGEMAYFGNEKKRTATVVATSDVVLRRISTEDFRTLPVIIKIFERIAHSRAENLPDLHVEDESAS